LSPGCLRVVSVVPALLADAFTGSEESVSYHSSAGASARENRSRSQLEWTPNVRIVLQKVARAQVHVDQVEVASIGSGLVALVAVERGDDRATVATAVDKLSNVRCFPDRDGRMNLNTIQAGGEFLVISQFTLAARLDRGRRPSFEKAAEPARAKELLAHLVEGLEATGQTVSTGRFGAHMEVELVNDGPVTLILEV